MRLAQNVAWAVEQPDLAAQTTTKKQLGSVCRITTTRLNQSLICTVDLARSRKLMELERGDVFHWSFDWLFRSWMKVDQAFGLAGPSIQMPRMSSICL